MDNYLAHCEKFHQHGEVFVTILSGVLVFVISQFLLELVIKPVVNHKKIIAKIDNKLKYYDNVVTNPPIGGVYDVHSKEKYMEATNAFRDLSCDLESSFNTIPLKFCCCLLNIVRNKNEIRKSAINLIKLSNFSGQYDKTGTVDVLLLASNAIDEVKKNLKIEN